MKLIPGKASKKAGDVSAAEVKAEKAAAEVEANKAERAKVAYKAAMDLFTAQDRTVSNLCTRATGIFATAAFVVTFSSSVRLIGNDNSKGLEFPFWAAVTLLVIILIQGFCVMGVLWPVRMRYGHSAYDMVNPKEEDVGRDPVDRKLVEQLVENLNKNKVKIIRMAWLYRLATLFLLAEVSVVLAAVISLL
ncbi:hypothetical protein ABZY81_17000 [Streptomyces sp. NPDC006514]|uniref:hypothetical protein n=1 Tax=Streptomyces sp. NPDC006514 TaxID=3154308 RepID=UPI0033AF568C